MIGQIHPKASIMKRSSLFALTAFTLAFAPAAWANTIATIASNTTRVMFGNGREITENPLNHIEVAIRAFDPCLSCATHALGRCRSN